MTESEILDEVIVREGGYKNDPEDPADPTNFGITAQVAGEWLKLGRRCTPEEMQTKITKEVAKDIYQVVYVEDPGFTLDNIPFEPLRIQLIDFGINSGPSRAIRWLQRVIHAPVTGKLDVNTLATLQGLGGQWQGFDAVVYHLINDALVAARLYMIDASTDDGSVNKKYEEGLESRAIGFFLARPKE